MSETIESVFQPMFSCYTQDICEGIVARCRYDKEIATAETKVFVRRATQTEGNFNVYVPPSAIPDDRKGTASPREESDDGADEFGPGSQSNRVVTEEP